MSRISDAVGHGYWVRKLRVVELRILDALRHGFAARGVVLGAGDEGFWRFGCTQFSVAILATLPVTASGHPGNVG